MAGSFAQHLSEILAGIDLWYFKKSVKRGADGCHIKWINIMRMTED